ncbi:MAG: phenylalanine--tRNA ligase subunit alpha [Candidatus Micrarchaeaceae archaeon]
MHRYEMEVLKALKKSKKESLSSIIKETGMNKDSVLWALSNLLEKKMITVGRSRKISIEVTDEGKDYAENGLPEIDVLKRLEKVELPAANFVSKRERIGLQWAKKKGLIVIEGGIAKITKEGLAALAGGLPSARLLKSIAMGGLPENEDVTTQKELDELVKRGLVKSQEREEIEYAEITDSGINALKSSSVENEIGAVDRSIIVHESWKGMKFKPYDINVSVPIVYPAIEHPMREVIDLFKDAYLGMGFSEVSGPIVLPAFWVFDSLFVPQDHPARDMQDTFYLSNPRTLAINDRNAVKRVKAAHEKGWGRKWDEGIAMHAVLRTHTTSVSAKYIYALEKNADIISPMKLFSIGRIFRNENIDYKHLAEFYQMDGIVIGKRLTLSNLFDVLIKVFAAANIKIKFRPSYFPFVEPGVEVSAYYAPKDEWLELGGAGIIRNEVTGMQRKSMTVLAWGLGLERIMLMQNPRISGINELYNHSIGWLRRVKYQPINGMDSPADR